MERNIGKQTKKKGSGGLFKKITGNKKTFHAKMGTIKDRNGMDLTQASELHKRLVKTEIWRAHAQSSLFSISGIIEFLVGFL